MFQKEEDKREKLASRIERSYKYCIQSLEEAVVSRDYSFDNLLIGKQESQIAKNALLWSDRSLLYGQDLKNYQRRLAQYIGVDESRVLLFYTAHAGLSFLLEHLRNMYPNRSEVIVPAFTCTVVTNAVTAARLKPLFVDIELDTYSLNIENLEEIVKKKGNVILAVIVQHLFGLVAIDYEKVIDLCKSHNIFVIGDCAPSLGTFYKGRSIGLLEDFAIFSSQSSKSINTYTGGILIMNSEIKGAYKSYEKLGFPNVEHLRSILQAYYLQYIKKTISRWYLPFFYLRHKDKLIPSLHSSEMQDNHVVRLQAPVLQHNKLYMRKFPNILAKIGLVQLSKLETFIERRTRCADDILKTFRGRLTVIPESRPAFLRIPMIKEANYKRKVGYEKGCLVGNWIAYYFGACPNAKETAEKLVNYMKIEIYD